jgi:hypothetical protein
MRIGGGRVLRRALFLTGVASALVCGQSVRKPIAKKAAAAHANELTLAGLRPGVDTVSRAIAKYKAPEIGKKGETQFSWEDVCRVESLFLDTDGSGKVETIRVTSHPKSTMADCDKTPRSPWRTGRGLAVYDSARHVIELYGEPDSRSPSTRDGQPLELWYYQFDWAGADVPQVMEVLCTKKDGQPSQVVEIMLAAPSL